MFYQKFEISGIGNYRFKLHPLLSANMNNRQYN